MDSKSQSELAEEFMTAFMQKKDKLSGLITQLSSGGAEPVTEKLTSLSEEIQLLSKQLHDAIIFLPAYSIKMRQNEIRELERALKEKEDNLVPKKKFGFKSKIIAPTKSVPIIGEDKGQSETGKDHVGNSFLSSNKTDNYLTIENITNETVKHDEKELNGNDVLVKNCEGATLFLEGVPSTLRLANLKKCKLLCGPVRTSIFVDNVQDSTLFLCCQQLRTHSSERLDIYLRVGSRAIIEDCNKIRFGPYKWNHPKSEELHQKGEISIDLERFDAVDDFNWLSSEPSPNWSLIPVEEYADFS